MLVVGLLHGKYVVLSKIADVKRRQRRPNMLGVQILRLRATGSSSYVKSLLTQAHEAAVVIDTVAKGEGNYGLQRCKLVSTATCCRDGYSRSCESYAFSPYKTAASVAGLMITTEAMITDAYLNLKAAQAVWVECLIWVGWAVWVVCLA